MLFYDSSGTAIAKTDFDAIKTFTNAGVALPSSTANNVLVSNAGTYESVAVSGDVTNNAGVFTVADDAITTDKIANDAIDGDKIADLSWLAFANEGQIVQKSSSDGQKMFMWSCADNKLTLSYSSNGGSTINVVQEFTYV